MINRLEILHELFDEVIVPLAVYQEVAIQGASRPGAADLDNASWIQVQTPTASTTIELMLMGLDAGELEVIMLARELTPDWVIIDERLGRRMALVMGLPVKGTVGILLAGFRAGYLSKIEAKDAVQLLLDNGIRLGSQIITWFETELEQP